MRRAFAVLGMVLTLSAAAPTPFGGWAVVTLEEVPEFLEVGKATTLSFKIRQHGVTLVNDFSPTVTLGTGKGGMLSRLLDRPPVITAVRGAEPGLYQATVTPSEPGEASITIAAKPLQWTVTLLPMRVVPADGSALALSSQERGRQLFAAKGCATCHTRKDDAAFADWEVVPVGPDLTGRSFANGLLAQKLRDPAVYRCAPPGNDKMPDLALDRPEIAALVSFLQEGRRTALPSGRR